MPLIDIDIAIAASHVKELISLLCSHRNRNAEVALSRATRRLVRLALAKQQSDRLRASIARVSADIARQPVPGPTVPSRRAYQPGAWTGD